MTKRPFLNTGYNGITYAPSLRFTHPSISMSRVDAEQPKSSKSRFSLSPLPRKSSHSGKNSELTRLQKQFEAELNLRSNSSLQ